MDDPALGLAPAELAGCVVRALSLPEVVTLRPRLKPEIPSIRFRNWRNA